MTASAENDLFAAIKVGDLDLAKVLVSADPTLVDAHNGAGESAVLAAVYHGRKAIADLLVARGAKLTLFEACAAGEFDRAERLLGSGAEVNTFSHDGWTPLHLAAFFGHPKVAELLLTHEADVAARSRNANANTPLHAALAANQKMTVGLLIGKGADVNAADAAGWRPLHLAAANNNLDAMQALIAQGAQVAVLNAKGQTPLDVARERHHREAAALLQRYGAA
jgi:ankyrin repeat protein